jgi:diguanylate cyclase (GGDEF)-like protein/PAS domain S-box-containing protein
MPRFSGPIRASQPTFIGLGLAALVAIFIVRLLVDDPAEPIMFLMVVPIGLMAAQFGIIGGLAAAAIASALVIAWDLIGHPALSSFGYFSRFLIFGSTALTVGVFSSSRRQLEDESNRWFEQSSDLNCIADLQGNFLRVNRAFEELLGYKTSELLGTPYISYVHPDDVDETTAVAARLAEGQVKQGGFENRYRAADGTYRWLRWTSITDHQRGQIYATARDITERKALEQKLLNLARTDSLTGLLNRRAFEEEASRQVDFLKRYGPGGALFLFDVDRFKSINDSLGHRAGDEALIKVASVMQARIRSTDVCCRLGGDEFVILFPGVGHHQSEILANGLLASLGEESIDADARPLRITLSIGIALFDQSEPDDLPILIARADQAMYEAKRAGGNRFAFHEREVDISQL